MILSITAVGGVVFGSVIYCLSSAALGGAGVGCVASATHAVVGAQATRACRGHTPYQRGYASRYCYACLKMKTVGRLG